MSIKSILKKMYKENYLPFAQKKFHNNKMRNYFKNNPDMVDLTEAEKREIDEFWGKYDLQDISYDAHKVLYNKTKLHDPKFVSEYVFYNKIKPYFNDSKFAVAWSDKNYLDYFLRGIDTVTSIVRNVDGRFLDNEFNLITESEAKKIINNFEKIVVKPTILTSVGAGVELYTNPFDLEKIDREYKKNYVIQLPLKQHAELTKLNASTTNTIRINTIMFDTKAKVVNGLVKIGEAGQFADNRGTNRYFLGFDENGITKDYCVDRNLNIFYKIPNGFDFAGFQIPHLDRIYKLAEDAHTKLAHFGMVFWDIVLKEDGIPVILEANLRGPDLMFGQVASGPFFGKHLEEFLEYYLERKNKFD